MKFSKWFLSAFIIMNSLFEVATVNASEGFDSNNTFELVDSYFDRSNRIPEYYRPKRMTPMISMLPEYSLTGPGYICDTRQAPPVYRMPLQYYRNVGYRESDWFNNRLFDRHAHSVNFGGYNY